jgi:hypothetical protein
MGQEDAGNRALGTLNRVINTQFQKTFSIR